MDKRYHFSDFVEIIRRLRDINGCPWDREQTHNSLKPCMTEEAAELLAAIRIYDKTGNAENMREELGDIMLQAVMHSVIAEEENLFTVEDVIQEVSEKMIRRHPHVFGTEEADTSEKVLANWEEIKKKEKKEKSWTKSPLRDIPEELPALQRACKVVKKADKLYGAAKQSSESCKELYVKMKKLTEQMEQADNEKSEDMSYFFTEMLWTMSELAYRKGLTPEQLLADKIAEEIELFEPE